MAVNTDAIGKTYPPTLYAVGREKIREYAFAVGESNPLHLDHEAARAAGYADVVAPPMFAVVYSNAAILPGLFDPEVGHRLRPHGPRLPGVPLGPARRRRRRDHHHRDVTDVSERGGMGFYVFETDSRNQNGETVCVGTWTNIVRAG